MSSELPPSFLKGLESAAGPGRLLTDPADLICYGYDASGYESCPGAVILPETTRQVAEILSLASKHKVPVYPRGAGSGTTGGAVPSPAGIAVVFTAMNRILEINPGNLTARVQPGVITGHLQQAVSEFGLFYPPDPASLAFCTIGGNVNTGAGGARAVKYGVTRDYVLNLEVALPSGDIITTGHATAKDVAGYDLTRLMVGSEGTLGIVTEITLRLIPAPEASGTALVFFPDASSACRAVKSFFQNRILPRCAEFFDKTSIECIKGLLPVSVPSGSAATLLVEVDGPESSISPQLDTIIESCADSGALKVVRASNNNEAQAMWRARRGLSPAIRKLGYTGKVSEDICVPRHRLPEAISKIEEISSEFNTRIIVFGHAGDGNLHVNLLFDMNDAGAVKDMEHAVDALMHMAVALSGTISGEHGIGLSKRDFMKLGTGTASLELMKGIKKIFDPYGIMNPGKVFP